MKQAIHFYDMAAVIGRPTRLFTGLEGTRGSFTTLLFILLCGVTLLAPLAFSMYRHRFARLAWLAPLALTIGVALLLNSRTSGDLFAENRFIDTLGNDFRHLANHLVRGAGAAIAQKVSLALGGYVAFASSAYLALRGLQRFREGPALHQERL